MYYSSLERVHGELRVNFDLTGVGDCWNTGKTSRMVLVLTSYVDILEIHDCYWATLKQ